MTNDTAHVADKLKSIIDLNGPSFLVSEPYKAYLELVESNATDRETSGAILHSLVNGILCDVSAGANHASLSKAIQKKCSLNERMANRLAEIYLLLYSPSNEKEWASKHLGGLRLFLDQDLAFTWKGFAIWDEGNGTVDCHYEAQIVLQPTEAAVNEGLSKSLDENPFLDASAIRAHFEKRLNEHLDGVFEDYCTCEDYYQPVVEDFEIDDLLEDWCKNNGFVTLSCEGSGHDGGYEPKSRFDWY